ncbi:MAG TPA: glucans biosynthesis glucosyltransferase MdoH, partial [Acidiferrobacteraceae bacterium]|nr:glucans biosynthesis glucosyltransferase MdoH [Acidiferrobacteraceae bacterium]
NIADFLRRWGRRYRYMVVLDADSVMAGEALVSLTRRMEANPRLGIIQTSPVLINRWSIFARMQQFASRFYGPLFAAGLRFWQLGDGHYIGHNAIVRVDAFMQHCALPSLSGKPPLGGHILSHDFVEAALMRRAGYGVWLDYETPGSYEENPSNVLEDLARDRRWCQGNLQHLRLLWVRGLNSAHRLLFVHGALSYLSSPLWLLFMAFSVDAGILAERTPAYFRADQFLPVWPISHSFLLLRLLVSTATMLLAPRVLAFIVHARTRASRRAFGGLIRALFSILLELLLSTLLAPIRMWFHTRFVSATLRGRKTGWKSPGRHEEGLSGQDVFDAYGLVSAVAAVIGFFIFRASPDLALWLSPVLLGLVLAAPVSWLTADPAIGRAVARLHVFETPEETDPPPVLQLLREGLQQAARDTRLRAGFVQALRDPVLYALHRRQLRARPASQCGELCARAVNEGPLAVSIAERRRILGHAGLMEALRAAIVSAPESSLRRWDGHHPDRPQPFYPDSASLAL